MSITCPKCNHYIEVASYRDQVCTCGNGPQMVRFLQVVLNSMKQVPRYMIPLPDGATPYLERLVLREYVDGSKDYLHVIWESDGDRDLHDHPFDFTSDIVWGSYKEELGMWKCVNTQCRGDGSWRYDASGMCGSDGSWRYDASGMCESCFNPLVYCIDNGKVYKAGDQNQKFAHQLHRLTLIDGPVVTLVRRGPKKREWGFQTPDGWVHHKPYIQEKFPNAQPTEVD